MDRISIDDFPSYKIELPLRHIQDRTASLLSGIDQKIQLNNKIIAELESMAKTIYDYWFVQFDFPDANGNPYRTSGGEMVWNEKLKREIPKGWKIKSAKSVFDVCYGFPFDTSLFVDHVTAYPVVRIRDILSCSVSAYTEELVPEKYWLSPNDLVIGMDGNFHMNFWDTSTALLNQRCVRIRRKLDYSALQAYFTAKPIIKARETNVNRTTVGHLSAGDIDSLYILVANDDLQERANSFFETTLCNITKLKTENQQLTALRDWLLPMLMNGQARVEETVSNITPVEFHPKQPTIHQVKAAARVLKNGQKADDMADLVRAFKERG